MLIVQVKICDFPLYCFILFQRIHCIENVIYYYIYMYNLCITVVVQVVAMSCLLLAGKVEETPKKSRDILKQAKALLSDHQFAKFGSEPRVRNV